MNKDNQSSRENQTDSVASSYPGRLGAAARASQIAVDRFDDCFSRFLGINRTDARCLDIIDANTRVTAGQLAEYSGLTTGAVTVVIDRLESAGYVARARDPHDRRKVWVAPTKFAKDLADRIFSHYQRFEPMFKGRYKPEEMAAIIDFLEMQAHVNHETSKLLDQHVQPEPVPPQARLVEARAFQRSVKSNFKAIIQRLDDPPV
ncbi:MarR family transcriptional regulator [Devosia algicola]|uniref:MarR family transcriptional regulator n=1 Tax=Devosia algicola TaxID=3026418 RepID=A0ABY7YMI3_9HYPH|nr:MarR family transcriptional regulator [Devosia algicola]WDR02501.1 MarR family transcriptional regulator [Devosia algicola]